VKVHPELKYPRMELRQIYVFVAVAEELHFGRAAARIHMAQSPLSRVIKKLESAIGTALFIRTKRSVRLTAAGTALLTDARTLLNAADELVDRALAAERSTARQENESVR
jgi:DNA-binding transcriptional LysR family regulator